MQRPGLTRILQRANRLRHQHRRYSRTISTEPIRVAICGAGPAGFYSASRLFALDQQAVLDRKISIDLFERLPSPFGLSRYGVAPDHPEVKNCEHKFAQVAEHPQFRYYGNTIVLGDDAEKSTSEDQASIRLKTLRSEYDVVLLSYGAGKDTSLGGIPGEENLSNILPGRAAVEWYNGYPTDPTFVDLSTIERVTIIGMGNVSLDIARILLTDTQVLAKTDISEKALEMLDKSRVKHVEIVGRRGPLQVAFTTRELRELVGLPNVEIRIDRELLLEAAERFAEPGALSRMANSRLSKRLLEVMLKASNRPSLPTGSRTCTLRFLRSPLSFHGASSTSTNTIAHTEPVRSIKWQINQLDYPPQHSPSVDYSSINSKPIFPPQYETSQTDLVIKSLGYQPILFRPLTYDNNHRKNRTKNDEGRVIGEDDQVVPGLYVTGWLSTGSKGVIGDTMNSSMRTSDTIMSDLLKNPPPSSSSSSSCSFEPTLDQAQFRVDWNMWKAIDDHERQLGKTKSKPRVKCTSVKQMLDVVGLT
ncbi:hypothetical protein MJO28_016543 [Puccinia striiformis f. sp. tritici]|uniref:NADPH:adrenodoxin oxidoreductase, mitochondrial n=3 Tax=Puccinia striiformis TaxID=27350 RepID=A0A0L0VUV8_9BASI|nr:hypothetical protein Pst134EA_030377 [Puccinia striiformis f. sp. tritici]KAI9600410.1 hypothetical protein H4Q26_000193 [Puccinia striiformis f. sp. tritici PST-130]KNF03058.1 hypothetical protein PSTG_03650 [Puccinia striiformis f. sp. tritici PST-78]POW12125.1 hypothetical protein PSTT_04707 [Puccinia striiformis]KAH9446459.1 hypothetical protein Pst134EA_030377 [Puccinia striiformis f. sp. tritici]KAI7935672.1 hypothetical protein MJO28_016543 [Puccinia striiformis f. sp. tritici]